MTDLDIIEGELAAYGGLEDRPRLVALNKVDVPDGLELAEMVAPDLRARGLDVHLISTKTGVGLTKLTYTMAALVAERRAAQPPRPAPRIVVKPKPVAGAVEFTIRQQGDGEGGQLWRVRGDKPERWIRQTDFSNPEAVGYLADRLNKLGVEDELLTLGAQRGDAVAIGGEDAVVFDFAPQVDIGAELLSRRGEDNRMQELRPAARRRRAKDAVYKERKAAERSVNAAIDGVDFDDEEGEDDAPADS
jgi:GTP-binding protein